MFFDGDGWFGTPELFDFDGEVWEISPDGAGGFMIMPFDPVGDMVSSGVLIIIFAISLAGVFSLGAPLAIAFATLLLGIMATYFLTILVDPVAGCAVLSTSLLYAFGTLIFACVSKFDTHNPMYLFSYLALAAIALLVWAYVGMTASAIGGFFGSAIVAICALDCAYLFLMSFADDPAKSAEHAFRIARYVLLGGIGVGVVMKAIDIFGKDQAESFSLGSPMGFLVAFGLGLLPPVIASAFGQANGIVAVVVLLALYAAIVVFMPNLGKQYAMSPFWLLIPLVIEMTLFIIVENRSGVLISLPFVNAFIDVVTQNPLITFFWHGAATIAAAISVPLAGVYNALLNFLLGLFGATTDPLGASLAFSAFVTPCLCGIAVTAGIALRKNLAKSSKAK